MLTLNEIEKILLQTDVGEKEYKYMYEKNPDACRTPIEGWNEFRGRFDEDVNIAKESPTEIATYLKEEEYFSEGEQVNCFKNVRYCPPFLHKLEFIKIIYSLKGTSIFHLNRKSYELKEGNFCIVSPNVEQAVFTEENDGVAVNILLRASTFKREFSNLLMEQGTVIDFFWKIAYTQYYNRVLFFNAKPDQKLRQIILRLFYEVNLEPHKSQLVQESYVCLFLGEAMRRHSESLLILEGLDGAVYQIPEMLKDMKSHLPDITSSELAKKWKCNESWLRYQLKMETGYSFSQLLLDLRLQEAARLLKQEEESIETIMEKIGYHNPVAFYRNFKKRYGMTPQMFRIHKSTLE